MGFDTKPNFSSNKFEQCVTDIMNLSGCTQIYGKFELESGSTLTICDNLGDGKVLTSSAGGVATWSNSAGISGVTNGLELFSGGTQVGLGGSLSQDTIINGLDTYNLSLTGTTLKIEDSAVLEICTGSGIDKILRSDAVGNATWIDIPVKDATNALTVTDGTVLLGGELIHETEIELNSNLLTISNQNPPFEIGTGFDDIVTAVAEQDDGKYLVAGRFRNYSGITANGLVRLFPDGSVDPTLDVGDGFWKSGGSTAVGPMVIDADGKILVAGSFTLFDNVTHANLVRLNTDGTYDDTFTPVTGSTLAGGRVIYIKDNGKVILGGDFTNHLIQLNADGTTDTGFTVGTGFAGGETVAWTFVLDIKEQTDGQLVIAGDYNSYSGITAGHLIRLNPDGSYDSSFDTNPGFDRRVRSIQIQSDGKIVTGGEFAEYSGTSIGYVARLNTDATLDDTWDMGTGFSGGTGVDVGPIDILKQVNGQYLMSGYFTGYNGTSGLNGVARINVDGTHDASFVAGSGFNDTPSDALVTSNGKFLLGGNFTTYSGVTYNRIIRLNYYGDIDNQALDSMVIFNGEVVEYGDNYESYYTNRSLVDKEYIDNLVATGTTNVSGENVTKEITQATHGLALNDFIGWSGGTYNKAIADGLYDGEFVGLISEVPDVNTFSVTQSGYVTGLTASFVANTTYWLSESTAGLLTSTEPSIDGEISKPAFIADTTSSGWVLPYPGVVVTSGASVISTADNGLTVNGGIVGLGGTLCQDTEIDVSTYGLSVCNLSGKTTQNNAIFVDSATGILVTGATSSGCGDYSSNSPSTCTVGGITAGTVLTGNTLECLLQEMLAPYIEPTFSAFGVAITSPMEVGDGLSGTKNFSWSTTTSGNVTANCIGICQVGGSVLGIDLANDGAESLAIGTLTNTSPTTYTWQITGCSTQGTPITRNVGKCSVYPYYWGVETDGARPAVDNDLVTGGTKIHTSNSCGTVTVDFNSSSEYTWIALPTNNPSTVPIRDCWYQTAFSNGAMGSGGDKYPDVCTLDITSGDGCWSTISYKVYMSAIAWTDSDPIQFCS